jgi:NitT/TauT family transport system substrate-binding protein
VIRNCHALSATYRPLIKGYGHTLPLERCAESRFAWTLIFLRKIDLLGRNDRMSIRRFLFLLFAFAPSFFSQTEESQAQLIKIRATYPSPNVQYLPAYLAQTKGIYHQEGLEVELIAMRGAKEGVQALVAGDIQFAMTLGPVLPAIWRGIDLKLLGQMVGMPTFSLIVRPEINRIEELKGKKIGVSFGGMTFALVHDLFKLHGIDPERGVEYINIPGSSPKVAFLDKGIIAAALIAPPTEFDAIRSGNKRLVYLGDVMPDVPFTGLIATSRYIKENPQIVKKMVRSTVRAVNVTRQDSEAAISVMKSFLKMNAQEATDTYTLVRKAFSPVLTEAGMKRSAAIVSKSAGMQPTKEPKDYMDLSFLTQVLAELKR